MPSRRQPPGVAELDGCESIVVVGGGPTGVELSGALTELLADLKKDFSHLDLSGARVTLLEHGDELLAPYRADRRRYARRALTDMGVDVRTGLAVVEVSETGVRLDSGDALESRTVIWAAGVTPVPFVGSLGLDQARGGRIVVDGHQRVPGRANVYAVGDVAATKLDDGASVPQLAQPAIQTGRHVAEVIVAELEGRVVPAFEYHDKGTMATIGARRAVVEFPERQGVHRRHGVDLLAGPPPVVPGRIPEPTARDRQLAVDRHHTRPGCAPDR